MRIHKLGKVKTFLVSLIITAALICWCGPARADQEGDFTYTVTAGQAQITGYTGPGGDVAIPSTLGGVPVTSIGWGAFEACENLMSVEIPAGVTSIGINAFYNCVNLTSVALADGLTSIGISAFENCTGLTSVTLPDGLKSIELGAFRDCESLTSISIPLGVTSTGQWVFSGCTSLNTVTLPDSLTSIDGWAFQYCESLTSINIPQGVTEIGYGAFMDCKGLTSITLPASVTSVGDWTFSECRGLTIITLSDGLTNIGYGAFDRCTSLTSIDIPSGVTSISDKAFYNCISLTSVTLPYGLTSIGVSAFDCCTALTGVTLPDSLASIGEYAFRFCESLTSVTIPHGLTNIGDKAFLFCDSLTSINVDTGNLYYTGMDGLLYNKLGTVLIMCPGGLTSISIPDGVTSISASAFENCTGLTSVTLPDGLTNIGDRAFFACEGLENINIPQGATSIGIETFSGCTALSSITIPASVTSIGVSAFDCCTGLTSVTLPDGLTNIGDMAFFYCESLTSINFSDCLISIGAGAFGGCTGLSSVSLMGGLRSIDMYAFEGCDSLTTITFNSATTSIYDDPDTIPTQATIIGYDPSTAKDYAEKYNRSFEVIGTPQSIDVASTWCYVYADATDQITGDITITANQGYDSIAGPYTANVIVTLPEGVTFTDNDTNTKTFSDVGLNESNPFYLYGDTDLVIDVGADMSGSIAADVRVYVQDGGEYVLDETESQVIAKVAANVPDATLSDLSVDGTTIQDFDSTNTIYNVVLPIGTTVVPTVTASVNDPGGATAEITPAISLPGTTTILVTAADGITTETYSIHFTVVMPVTVTSASPNVNVDDTPLQVTVPSDVSNASLTTSPVDNAVFLPQISVHSSTSMGDIAVYIMNETEVIGPTDWDGIINLPQVVDPGSITVTPENGYEASVSGAIELGITDTTLTFSQPVRILLAGQGGKKAGWILNETFTPITYEMASDTAEALGSNPDGYLTVGSDLVIWTTHFTTFVAYTETPLAGYTLSGQVLVEGDDLTEGQIHYSGGVSIELIQGEELKYSAISSVAEDLTTNGTFSITGIAAGDYTVVISKAGYLTRSFALTINSDLILSTTSDLYHKRIYLWAGDIVSDEYHVIAAADVNYILSKFNSDSTQASFDPQVDIVKDQYNVISAMDVNLMLSNFNKNSTQYPADIVY